MASLKRTVYVQNRIKTDNESIYYVVNDIYQAIQTNRIICFQYMDWNLKKQKVARHNGEKSRVSPLAMTFKDENYYLIAFDNKDKKVKHYRVDKIKNVEITENPREGLDALGDLDVATYTNKSFGMYGGEEITVTLKFLNKSVGIIVDRF